VYVTLLVHTTKKVHLIAAFELRYLDRIGCFFSNDFLPISAILHATNALSSAWVDIVCGDFLGTEKLLARCIRTDKRVQKARNYEKHEWTLGLYTINTCKTEWVPPRTRQFVYAGSLTYEEHSRIICTRKLKEESRSMIGSISNKNICKKRIKNDKNYFRNV